MNSDPEPVVPLQICIYARLSQQALYLTNESSGPHSLLDRFKFTTLQEEKSPSALPFCLIFRYLS